MLNIVVAHRLEASPVIEGLSLKSRAWRGEQSLFLGPMCRLIISGQGAEACSQGTARLMEIAGSEAQPDTDPFHRTGDYWLNFGIAGSACAAVGSLAHAGSVTDAMNHEHWRLEPFFRHDLPTVNLLTVPSPKTVYEDDEMYDMEAAGMLRTLSRQDVPALHRVAVLKLISDGPQQPVTLLNRKTRSGLMAHSRTMLIACLRQLCNDCAGSTV